MGASATPEDAVRDGGLVAWLAPVVRLRSPCGAEDGEVTYVAPHAALNRFTVSAIP